MTLDPADLDRVVRAALEEDLRYGPDVTTAAVIPPGTKSVADVVARQPGTLAGLPVVAAVLDVACPAAAFTPQARDGDRVATGDVVARVEGPLAEILTAERTLLNFLTHLSGIATATRAWVDAIDGTGAFVRDTRKTVPGLRALEKYAVRCGGGVNHRMGLGDAALIKDNHVAAAGGVTAAFRAVLAAAPGVVVEVECDTLDQVGQALAAGAALILLDNMSLDQMRSAVAMARAYPAAKLEASGGLRLENAREVASTGVHYLSVGALTHSSPALDLALDVSLPADACYRCTLRTPRDAAPARCIIRQMSGVHRFGLIECSFHSFPALLEFDAVLGEPGQQVMAPGADEAASGEPGVAGDLGDRRRRREERLCLGVRAELDVRHDQAVQRRFEDVDAQRRDAQPGLGQHRSREGGEQVVFGRGQVGIGDQSLDVAGPAGGHLLGELELAVCAVEVVDTPQAQARARQVPVGDAAPAGDGRRWRRAGQQEASFPFDPGVLTLTVGHSATNP